MKINQPVRWLGCPPSVPVTTTRVRGLSPCGRFALVSWVYHPIALDDLKPVESTDCAQFYKPIAQNQWSPNGVDLATGGNLLAWVSGYDSRADSMEDF